MAKENVLLKNVFLVGPAASGKSTIGRMLANKLQLPFYDTDQLIVERTGVSVTWIFDIEGEAKFRQRESAVIDELSQYDGLVLATGGGAILSEQNRRYLKERGVVVYLQSSVVTQLKRTKYDKTRPLLKTNDRKASLEAMAKKRNPLYESIADIQVSTDKRSIKTIVNQIVRGVKSIVVI